MATLSEADIAALYQKHGYALFLCCLRITGTKGAGKELVLAAFCELAKKRVRLSPFETLCKLAAELAARPEPALADDDIDFARYLADDSSGLRRSDLESRLAGNNSLQVKLAVVRAERTAFYASDPPAEFAQRVLAVLASRGETPAPARAKLGASIGIGAGLLATALVSALGLRAWFARPVEVPPPAPAPVAAAPVIAPPPASAPVVVAVQPAPEPKAEPEPKPEPSPAPKPAPAPKIEPASRPAAASKPTTDTSRMMATFDFGEPIGRVSIYEGRVKQKAVPAGTSLQVRATFPEEGYAAVIAVDAETKTPRALTSLVKVEPRWHVLARTTIDKGQRLYAVFSPEQVALADLTKALSDKGPPGERHARIDVTIEAPAE